MGKMAVFPPSLAGRIESIRRAIKLQKIDYSDGLHASTKANKEKLEECRRCFHYKSR